MVFLWDFDVDNYGIQKVLRVCKSVSMQEPLVRFCFDQSLKNTGIFPLQSGPHVSLKLESGNLAEGLSF